MSAVRWIANRVQITSFYDALFRHAPAGSFVSLRCFYDKGEELDDVPYWPFETVPVDDRQRLIARACARATWAANHARRIVFCPPVATFSSRTSASAGSLAAGLCLSVECDANAEAAVAYLSSLVGPPTLVVASGGVEADGADKLHGHWRLRRPAETEDERDKLALARQLACALVGGDPTNNSPVHPIRWPGSWHRKAKPRMARIVEANDAEIDLDQAYGVLVEAADARGLVQYGDTPAGSGNPEKLASSIDDVALWLRHIPAPPPDPSQTTFSWWNHIGMATWAATGGSAEGLALFLEWSATDPNYDSPIHQAAVARRWKHYGRSPPTKLGAGRLYYLFNEHWSDSGDDAGDGDVIEGDVP